MTIRNTSVSPNWSIEQLNHWFKVRTATIAAAYAISGILWILFSDRILIAVVSDHTRVALLGTYKGIAFVTVTTLLLVILLNRTFKIASQAYRALSEVKEAFRNEKVFADTMIESMPGIIYFYDSEGLFLRWNKNFETVSGYSDSEIAHLHPRDFFRGNVFCESKNAFRKYLRRENLLWKHDLSTNRGQQPRIFSLAVAYFIKANCVW